MGRNPVQVSHPRGCLSNCEATSPDDLITLYKLELLGKECECMVEAHRPGDKRGAIYGKQLQ